MITSGTVTGLNILDHGSAYLYTSTYFMEVTGSNPGSGLNITATLGNLVYTNITNDGSTDIDTDFAWLFSDGGAPINLSDGHDGYQPTIIFPGETHEFTTTAAVKPQLLAWLLQSTVKQRLLGYFEVIEWQMAVQVQ